MKTVTLLALMAVMAGAFALSSCKSKKETYVPPATPGYVESGK